MNILLLLDEAGCVKSQIISVVCKIQRFDFDFNLVVTRKNNNTDTAGFRKKSSALYTLQFVTLSLTLEEARSKPQDARATQRARGYRALSCFRPLRKKGYVLRGKRGF
jgi:hypothetical protein